MGCFNERRNKEESMVMITFKVARQGKVIGLRTPDVAGCCRRTLVIWTAFTPHLRSNTHNKRRTFLSLLYFIVDFDLPSLNLEPVSFPDRLHWVFAGSQSLLHSSQTKIKKRMKITLLSPHIDTSFFHRPKT